MILDGNLKKLKDKKVLIKQNISAQELANIMTRAKIGILPASSIAIEALACRLPILCGYFVDNQLDIYKALKNSDI